MSLQLLPIGPRGIGLYQIPPVDMGPTSPIFPLLCLGPNQKRRGAF